MDELPQDRACVLRAYPDAVWFPDDECPIGERVLIGGDIIGVVEGVYNNNNTDPLHDCPSCQCKPQKNEFTGWWRVRLEGWKRRGDTYVQTGDPDDRDCVQLGYPPSLQRATEPVT